MLKADGVFEGGGVKGIGLIGAVCFMESKGYRWQRLAGTSVGAIIASLLAVGYSGNEIKNILYELKFSNFVDKGFVQSIPIIGKPLSILIQKGIYTGDKTETFLEELYRAKGKTKFKDVIKNGESRLKVIASDITGQDIMILPDDLKKYDIDPMEFSIAKAVRMSIGVPYFFKPIILNIKNETHFIVDGGLMSNFPVWIFDVNKIPRWPTFGFKLDEGEKSKTSTGKKDIISYTFDIINTALEQNESIYIKNKHFIRTISIPTLGVRTVEFNIDPKKKEMLFNSGYNAAKDFLIKWNFERYVQTYRIENNSKTII